MSGVRVTLLRPRRRGLHIVRDGFFVKSHLSLISSLLLSVKGHARLAYLVVNALATARCRYQPFAGYEGSNLSDKSVKISFYSPLTKNTQTLKVNFVFSFNN